MKACGLQLQLLYLGCPHRSGFDKWQVLGVDATSEVPKTPNRGLSQNCGIFVHQFFRGQAAKNEDEMRRISSSKIISAIGKPYLARLLVCFSPDLSHFCPTVDHVVAVAGPRPTAWGQQCCGPPCLSLPGTAPSSGQRRSLQG